jgi:hypothetical protein
LGEKFTRQTHQKESDKSTPEIINMVRQLLPTPIENLQQNVHCIK